MDFVLIALLTALNGAFAMSELALTASRKARLTALAEAGDAGAAAALRLIDQPTTFLSAVQIGITSIGMLNGIVGEAAFSDDLATVFHGFGLSEKAAAIAATAVVVTVITFVTIVFGELVPKRIGQLYPESVARVVARPMALLVQLTRPLVRLLSLTTQATLRLLRVDNNAAREVTEEEIAASLEEGVDAGVIGEHEHRMVRNLFHLDDRPLTSLMTPRADIVWLAQGQRCDEALARAATSGHSWYPVCRGGLDDVVGVVSLHGLLAAPPGQGMDALMARPTFIPESLSGLELLEHFRRDAARLVFVVDEYGVVQGLLTPHDLLEAITGELKPSAATEAWATPQPDGSWQLDGLMPVAELKVRLDIDDLPDEDRGRYNTLAGLLMALSGRLSGVGEQVEVAGWRFEVLRLEGRRIDQVRAVRATGSDGSP